MTISRKIRMARKEHRCDTCGAVIKQGEKYARLYGMAERYDPPYEVKVCLVCDDRAEQAKEKKREGR